LPSREIDVTREGIPRASDVCDPCAITKLKAIAPYPSSMWTARPLSGFQVLPARAKDAADGGAANGAPPSEAMSTCRGRGGCVLSTCRTRHYRMSATRTRRPRRALLGSKQGAAWRAFNADLHTPVRKVAVASVAECMTSDSTSRRDAETDRRQLPTVGVITSTTAPLAAPLSRLSLGAYSGTPSSSRPPTLAQ
jgi:hypothetical protein